MRKLMLAVVLMLSLFVPGIKAQTNQTTRYFVGVDGADTLDNLNAGITAGIDVPVKRFEISLIETYSPYEQHIGQGTGHANLARVRTLGWFHKSGHIGVFGDLEDSGYSVTKVSKTAAYVRAGLVTRFYFEDIPTRFSIGVADQFNNGIDDGVETSHLKGAFIAVEGTPYNFGKFTLRFIEEFQVGRVLEQGNPVCDGTYGNGSQVGFSPCPRTVGVGGGVDMKLVLQPRHDPKHDNELY